MIVILNNTLFTTPNNEFEYNIMYYNIIIIIVMLV